MTDRGTATLIIVLIALIVGCGYLLVPPFLEIINSQGTFDVEAFPVTASRTITTSTTVESWKIYRNEKYGFTFRYPADWPSDFSISAPEGASWIFQNTSIQNNLHGIGLPPVGNVWIEINQNLCNPTGDFMGLGGNPNILEKTVCRDGFQITLGLWSNDPHLSSHKALLNQILSTFKFIK